MRDPVQNELRQIKWILAGIAACLAIIVLAVAPVLVPIIFVLVVGVLIAGLVLTVSDTARNYASGWWRDLSRRWR